MGYAHLNTVIKYDTVDRYILIGNVPSTNTVTYLYDRQDGRGGEKHSESENL